MSFLAWTFLNFLARCVIMERKFDKFKKYVCMYIYILTNMTAQKILIELRNRDLCNIFLQVQKTLGQTSKKASWTTKLEISSCFQRWKIL